MSDSSRTDGSRAFDAAPGADRDAKIEQLLLVGLDHYFAGQFEHAVSVWTRALFLDRSHARARAYIDRARSALAERQRESEELLHTGVAAFQRGDGEEARRLLKAAIDSGAPADEALAVLDRLSRLDANPAAGRVSDDRAPNAAVGDAMAPRRRTGRPGYRLAASIVVVLAVLGALAAAFFNGSRWRTFFIWQEAPAPVVAAPAAREAVPALPRRGETALARARALAAAGHLRDALLKLDGVRPTDTQKAEADRLRADIQRQLLGLRPLPRASGNETREKADARQP